MSMKQDIVKQWLGELTLQIPSRTFVFLEACGQHVVLHVCLSPAGTP